MVHVSVPFREPRTSDDESEERRGDGKITSVGQLYRRGHFRNDDEARGAFRLALQQYLDGCGSSLAVWMGISEADAEAYKRWETLPRKRR